MGRNGALGIDLRGSIWAILIAHVFYNLAVVIRTVSTAWERIDPEVESEQHTRLGGLREGRDAAAAESALTAVREACQDGSNLQERFVAAAHAYCTLGEIAQVLREEFDQFKEPKIL